MMLRRAERKVKGLSLPAVPPLCPAKGAMRSPESQLIADDPSRHVGGRGGHRYSISRVFNDVR